MSFFKSLFGNYSKKELKRVKPIMNQVLELEDKYKAMTEEELKDQTNVLKERLANGETTDDILPDAFGYASLSCTGYRRYSSSSGTNCRNAYR